MFPLPSSLHLLPLSSFCTNKRASQLLGSSMSMERQPRRRLFDFFLNTFVFLLLILQGLCAYGFAAFLASSIARCGRHLLYRDSDLSRFFFSSQEFILLVLHALNTQIYSVIFVRSFATLYPDIDFSRFRAMAILAGLRKGTVPTVFMVVAAVGAYIAVFWPAFWLLLHVPGQFDLTLMLLGAAPYFAGTVGIAVVCECRLACAVPVVLEDASESCFGDLRRGLALIGARKFWVAAAMFALLDDIFVAVAVLTADPSPELAAWTAANGVVCTVAAVSLVSAPVLYLPSAALSRRLRA